MLIHADSIKLREDGKYRVVSTMIHILRLIFGRQYFWRNRYDGFHFDPHDLFISCVISDVEGIPGLMIWSRNVLFPFQATGGDISINNLWSF